MTQAAKQKAGIESTLGAITAHPTRVECYVMLTERVASPNEIAAAAGLKLSDVAYHVRKLEEFKVIELVDTKQRRGATEHFYRATKRPFASDADFAEMTPKQRDSLSRYIMQLLVADVQRALDAGTFDARSNRWLARLPGQVDEEGFAEMNSLHEEMYERELEIMAKSASRLNSQPAETSIPIVAAMMFFEPPPKRNQ